MLQATELAGWLAGSTLIYVGGYHLPAVSHLLLEYFRIRFRTGVISPLPIPSG